MGVVMYAPAVALEAGKSSFQSFCRAMLGISAAYAAMRYPSVCPSVRPSVTFMNAVKTSKHLQEF